MSLVEKVNQATGAEPVPGSPEDPFRLGWRYVRRVLPDGEEDFDQIPLTLEDLMFPEEEDHAMHNPAHAEDCMYLYACLKILLADVPRALVLADCRVDFAIPGVRPMGPDIAVFLDVDEGFRASTLRVGELGAQPVLVIEVTSPETRHQDIDRKRDFYHRGNVPCYVIVDSRYRQEVRHDVRLLGFRHTPEGYEPIPLDDQGRLLVESLHLWLTVVDDRVVGIDATTGRVIEQAVDLFRSNQVAQAELRAARAEASLAQAETRTARAEASLAQAETRTARAETRTAQAEASLAQAETRAARAETRTAQAEASLAQAEARAARAEASLAQAEARAARAEASLAQAEARTARAEAEVASARAASEAAARLDLEAQLAAMQAEVRRLRGEG